MAPCSEFRSLSRLQSACFGDASGRPSRRWGGALPGAGCLAPADRTFALCSAGILQRRGPRSRPLSSYGGSDRAVNFTDTTCRQLPRCYHFWSACCATRVNCGRCFGRCIIGRWGSFETIFSGRPLGRRAGHFRQLRPFVSSHDGRAGSGHLEMGAGPRVRRENCVLPSTRGGGRGSAGVCPAAQKAKSKRCRSWYWWRRRAKGRSEETTPNSSNLFSSLEELSRSLPQLLAEVRTLSERTSAMEEQLSGGGRPYKGSYAPGGHTCDWRPYMMDLASSSTSFSSRGAQGRVKLQQELAQHRGTFFNAVFCAMARRMQPARVAEASPQELATRGGNSHSVCGEVWRVWQVPRHSRHHVASGSGLGSPSEREHCRSKRCDCTFGRVPRTNGLGQWPHGCSPAAEPCGGLPVACSPTRLWPPTSGFALLRH